MNVVLTMEKWEPTFCVRFWTPSVIQNYNIRANKWSFVLCVYSCLILHCTNSFTVVKLYVLGGWVIGPTGKVRVLQSVQLLQLQLPDQENIVTTVQRPD